MRHCDDQALLEALRDRIRAAGVPKRQSPTRWARVEKQLKVKLPEDYKWLMRQFESFFVRSYLMMLSPSSVGSGFYTDLVDTNGKNWYAYEMRWECFDPEPDWRPERPADRSFLAWMDANSDSFAWEMRDGELAKTIFYIPRNTEPEIEYESESWAHFLIDVIDAKIVCPDTDDFAEQPPIATLAERAREGIGVKSDA